MRCKNSYSYLTSEYIVSLFRFAAWTVLAYKQESVFTSAQGKADANSGPLTKNVAKRLPSSERCGFLSTFVGRAVTVAGFGLAASGPIFSSYKACMLQPTAGTGACP